MRRLVGIVLALTLLAAACSDDGGNSSSSSESSPSEDSQPEDAGDGTTTTTSTTTTSTTTTTTVPPVRASAGCGAGGVAGTEDLTLDTTDGLTREYRRHVPAVYDDATAAPVVLNLHGYTSNISDQVLLSRLETLAEDEGFVVLTPQGTLDDTGTTFWNASAVTDDVVDDVQFVHELLDRTEADLCVDLDRVYSTGMSNGGFMSGRLACSMPERIAAIAGVTGLIGPVDCADDRLVPIMMFHGTADAVVNYDRMAGFVDDWAAVNGCSAATDEDITAEVSHRVYDCAADASVEFYTVAEGGHTWPGSPLPEALAALLGYTTVDIDATALMWEFFERHPIT